MFVYINFDLKIVINKMHRQLLQDIIIEPV